MRNSAAGVFIMLSSSLRQGSSRLCRPLSKRHFSASPQAKKIITPSGRLNAKEVSPLIGNKYPIVDHEYDALVVGAGGSGASLVPATTTLCVWCDLNPLTWDQVFELPSVWLRLVSTLRAYRSFSPPARTRLPRREVSMQRWETCTKMTGGGTCTIPSRARTG